MPQTFIDFLGKAKKILKSDVPTDKSEKLFSKSSSNPNDFLNWDPQEIGMKQKGFDHSFWHSGLKLFMKEHLAVTGKILGK